MKRISLQFDFQILDVQVHHSMYGVTDSVNVSIVQIYIWLKTMFTAYWFRSLPTVRHLQRFAWLNLLLSFVLCLEIGIQIYYTYLLHSQEHWWVQNTGARICSVNRRWSSAATGSAATILRKTCPCILTRRAPRTPELMKIAHNKPIAISHMIMTVQCIWFEERLYLIPT